MVVGENKRANIMDGIENTGDVRLHDHRLRLKQRFDIVRKLGQGTYGKVQLGINKKTGQEVAIKTIKKCKIETEADLIRIRREVQIMSSVRHPNIVHIYEVFENSEKMILVMEYCSGGELYDYLSQKKVLQEDEARRLFRQIATAVYYCHIHKICHRDLKLENVLVDDTGSAKIADFGLSNVFKETSLLSTFCGSPLYASPEIVKGTPYIGPEVDCWSLGVLLYTLVYGAMPFDGSNFKRLVRQISNGDYYEPKNPSTASSLIRDMLTVDPLKRADIAYICDHPWVNAGCSESCLEVAEALAAQTPVRLDLLLSLAPAAPSHSNSVVVPTQQQDLGPEESCTDLTTSTSMAVEPSNSAEKRILDLVAEGGEDAIKPSPTRTIVSAGDNKRKLELAMSASGLHRKKERAASSASIAAQAPVPEEGADVTTTEDTPTADTTNPPTLKSSATITIQPLAAAPALVELTKDATRDIVKQPAKDAPKQDDTPAKDAPKQDDTQAKARVTPKKKTTKPVEEKPSPDKKDDIKEETKPSAVSSAADKLTSLSLSQPAQSAQPAQTTPPAQTPKPKKLSIPGGNVGSFKEQFERRASLTSAPEVKRNVTKPVSKIGKPKAQSEDRELTNKSVDTGPGTSTTGTVRLQQIGIEPTPTPAPLEESSRGGVKKTESEPSHSSTSVDPSVLLQDARRSLQNSMAKLVEERAGEDRRRAARDIISTAIRTGKPPVPYGRSSSAGVASLSSPPHTPPAAPSTAPSAATVAPSAAAAPRVFRTEAQHRVEDHRNRGVSVERIIPINLPGEEPASPPQPAPLQPPQTPALRPVQPPLRRLVSNESNASECGSPSPSPSGEPIKKSAREFIIPIAVEGKGYVTPRQRSLEPDTSASAARLSRTTHTHAKPRRISSLVSGGESEEEDDSHMHRLRSSRAARAESVSSGEEDEEDEGFHLLTAENLFSTLLHRVRALTNRLNGEEGPGFPQHPHSLFNNLHQSPFFNSPHLPRRHLLREGWGSRDLHADLESMFNTPRAPLPRGSSKRSETAPRATPSATAEALDLSDLDLSSIEFSEKEMRALSGLTPALSRRLQRQLLEHLPPAAARQLRRTLSLHGAPPPAPPSPSSAASTAAVSPPPAEYCTLPRLRRPGSTPPATPERPLLSKYLTPERALSLDDTCSDGRPARAPSAPLAPPPTPATSTAPADAPRKRISRFLRSDFFDTPPDESVYAKHKKEKELETQKILREIREKKNKSLEALGVRSPTEAGDETGGGAGGAGGGAGGARRALAAPVKERSRSNTPFFPILDNIKENTIDPVPTTATTRSGDSSTDTNEPVDDGPSGKDTKLMRPKSYPVKHLDSFDEPDERAVVESTVDKASEIKDKTLPRESKLIRPKSYPTSSPSPEKVFVNRTVHKDESKNVSQKENRGEENKNDVEVSFSITLPKKTRPIGSSKIDTFRKSKSLDTDDKSDIAKTSIDSSILVKKYQVVGSNTDEKSQQNGTNLKIVNGSTALNGVSGDSTINETPKLKLTNSTIKNEEVKIKSTDTDSAEKKGTIKKKIIKKVSSKSKTEATNGHDGADAKVTGEKKKVTKKTKEKSAEEGAKPTSVTKKKSVLQSIGHKLEKFASNKSSSPEKNTENNTASGETKKDNGKTSRTQREQSVPALGSGGGGGGGEGVQRAVTLGDVAALDVTPQAPPNKTTVSKVLGLFKKFDSKDRSPKPEVQKSQSDNIEGNSQMNGRSEPPADSALDGLEIDKPRRPTSLLLNGLGRRTKYGRNPSDSISSVNLENDDDIATKKESNAKNIRNSLKLDFSRLPRVKKIVPTNSVIEPQIMNIDSDYRDSEKKDLDRNGTTEDISKARMDTSDSLSRSRSRSRSTFSNSEIKSDNSAEIKFLDKNPLSLTENSTHHPVRNHESTTPEKEDIIERIRRKSFYSRFNEKKQRRKSNLVGPGAAEYDPLARIHAQTELASPPAAYLSDLSPGYCSDLSPATDRYRSLLADLPATPAPAAVAARTNARYDTTYGLNDNINTYRSLDRNEFRKYPSTRSYLDYDQPSSYTAHRYSRTKSLLDSSDGAEDHSLGSLRDPLKYNRTISMYSPGSYATYRPKRMLNSAIILKESEKEPSPENILEKIRQRKKISISVTRKPDTEKDPLPRSDVPPKGEGDSSKCFEKTD